MQQQQQQRWLKDMGLPQQDLQLLSAQNIQTARDLLTLSVIDLVERLNIPLSQAQRILQQAAVQVAPPYITVSQHTTPACCSALVRRSCHVCLSHDPAWTTSKP